MFFGERVLHSYLKIKRTFLNVVFVLFAQAGPEHGAPSRTDRISWYQRGFCRAGIHAFKRLFVIKSKREASNLNEAP